MKNGIELVDHEGDSTLLAFSRIVKISKCQPTKSSEASLFVSLDTPMGIGIRIVDPAEMERLWGAYRNWIERDA